MTTYTKEQREAWDKITGPGLYTVYGDGGYSYLVNRIKWMVLNTGDPHTILTIGSDDDKAKFLKKVADEGAFEWPTWEPDFFCFQDCSKDDDDDLWARSTGSEVDTEMFCNFIRHAPTNGYFPIGAVVILNEACGDDKTQKYLDRLLKIPVWRGSVIEKNIELPVFNVSHAEWSEFSKVNNSTPSGVKQTLQLTRGDEIEEKSVEWLVPEFYPKNEVTICTGQMDTLKSTTNIDIAAAGSGFRPWFMGDQHEDGVQVERHPFVTLYAASEDDPARTILPRYKAAGGNPDCLYFLKLEVKNEKTTPDGELVVWETPMSLDEHIELLREHIRYLNTHREWPVGLLVLDPLITMFGSKNYCSPQDANDLMVKLRRLCTEEQITVVGIAHYNKTQGLVAKDKTSGAKRTVESARMAWGFDRDGDSETTIISPIKKNLLAKAKSYKITTVDRDGVGVIKFLGFTDVTADEQIDAREDKGRGQRKELKAAIVDVLKDGPMAAGQVCNQLQDMGSISSIGRAARSLEEEGKLRKSGNNRKNMFWQLATDAEQPTFDEVR